MLNLSNEQNHVFCNTIPSDTEDSYNISELYHSLTGRKGAWIYKDLTSSLIVCQHPHIVNTLMVFPEVGLRHYSLTARVLQKLQKSQHDIQLSRYTNKDILKLKDKLDSLDLNLVKSIEDIQEDQMDWKYPSHIFDTQILSELYGNTYRRIRQKYSQLSKAINVKPINHATAIKDMRVALKYWEGSMIDAGRDTDDMLAFYNEFLKVLSKFDGTYDGFLYFHGRRPVGFSVHEIIQKDTANFFISVCDNSTPGLSDFQIVETCRHLNMQGIKYLNVGGSETESLDAYKRKFKPCKSIQLYSAKVNYIDFDMPDVTYRKFI